MIGIRKEYVSSKIDDTYISTIGGPGKDYLYDKVCRYGSKIEIELEYKIDHNLSTIFLHFIYLVAF